MSPTTETKSKGKGAKRAGNRTLDAFAAAFTTALRQRSMTQLALAEAIGVTQSQVSTWANGVYAPSPNVVAEIEEALTLTPGALTRHLGYLPLTYEPGTLASLPEAIAACGTLDDAQKAAVAALVAHYEAVNHEAAHPPKRRRAAAR